jgi:hypothetical protein
MNWKHLLNKTNASTYKWPEGWDTREEVAAQLECSPDRVREVLAPAIRGGSVEAKEFKIWEDGRFVRKTGFRAAADTKPSPTKIVLAAGLRVQTRSGASQGVVTAASADEFTVDYGDKQTTYAIAAWQKRDIRPSA